MAEQPPRKRLSLAQMDRNSPLDKAATIPDQQAGQVPQSAPEPVAPSLESKGAHPNGTTHLQEAPEAMHLAPEEGNFQAE